MRLGRAHGTFEVTDRYSERLARLPLWVELEPAAQDEVIRAVLEEARAADPQAPRMSARARAVPHLR
jgi:hypothetical protein